MKKALLIGINKYPSLEQLKGAVNDVRLWKNILLDYDFEKENITTLDKPGNTYSGDILKQMRILTTNLKANDVGVIMFSGHGGQKTSFVDGKGKIREFIYPYNDDRIIYDDEIKAIIDLKHPNAQLIFIADCCHAGGMLGQLDSYVELLRSMNFSEANINIDLQEMFSNVHSFDVGLTAFDVSNITPEKFSQEIASSYQHNIIKTEGDYNQLLLASSEKDQLSKETKVEGEYYGVFSHYASEILKNTRKKHTYVSLMQEVKDALLTFNYEQKVQLIPKESKITEASLFTILDEESMFRDIDDEDKEMLTGTISKDGKMVTVSYMPSFSREYYDEDVKILKEGNHIAVVFRISDKKTDQACHCPGDHKSLFKHEFSNKDYGFKEGDKIRVMYLNDRDDILDNTKIKEYFKYMLKKITYAPCNHSLFEYWTKSWNNTQSSRYAMKLCDCPNKEPRSGGNGGVIGFVKEN